MATKLQVNQEITYPSGEVAHPDYKDFTLCRVVSLNGKECTLEILEGPLMGEQFHGECNSCKHLPV